MRCPVPTDVAHRKSVSDRVPVLEAQGVDKSHRGIRVTMKSYQHETSGRYGDLEKAAVNISEPRY